MSVNEQNEFSVPEKPDEFVVAESTEKEFRVPADDAIERPEVYDNVKAKVS